ncbi:AAA family ATPase [Thiohalocapsa halophila]|nr:AAA family ATPase [Thiohalocapsa halophila]
MTFPPERDERVNHWLDELGLSELADVFARERIDWELLPELGEADLRELAIPLGHRKRLLQGIDGLRAAPPAAVAPAADDAERRLLTVLFSDLVGYTALGRRLDAEDLQDVLDAYRSCCGAAIERFGGHVANYLGDGVMVYFGYPKASEQDAERAVHTALDLMRRLGAQPDIHGVRVQARVGIATGPVVVGRLIGLGTARERSVVGETPSLAARLQSLAAPGAVVVADSTRRLTGGLFDWRDLGPQVLKGFDAPVPAWQPLGERQVDSRFEARRQLDNPGGEAGGEAGEGPAMIGRDAELSELLSLWQQCEAGRGSLVLLRGEAGIGKSRLVQALRAAVAQRPHVALRLYGSPYFSSTALYPLIAQLERSAGFHRHDDTDTRLDKLTRLLAETGQDHPAVLPLFADVLSLPTDRWPSLELTPQLRRAETLRVLLERLRRVAERAPVLLVLEDLHWVDPTTLELLGKVADMLAELPLLVVLTARPEQREPPFEPLFAPDGAHPAARVLELARLSPGDTARVMVGLAGKPLAPALYQRIHAKADGVPLFVEELTKNLLESGALAERNGELAAAGGDAALAIPDTLRDSLMARLDRLPDTRELAQVGAVIGRQFSHTLLARVLARDPAELAPGLGRLAEAELVFASGGEDHRQYSFKHALVQDAAYNSLLRRRRRALHQRVAAVLEAELPDVVTGEPELLAHHHAGADQPDRAATYWQRAGERALQRSANEEAIAYLNRALPMVERLPASLERNQLELGLYASLGPALMMARGYTAQEVQRAYERAGELCSQVGETPLLVPALFGLWIHYAARFELAECRRMGEQLFAVGAASGDPDLILETHVVLGSTTFHMAELEKAAGHLRHVVDHYDPERHGHHAYTFGQDPRVAAGVYLANTLWCLGESAPANAMAEQALGWARDLGHPYSLALGLVFAARVRQKERDAAGTERLAQEAVSLSQRQGFPAVQCMAQGLLGWALVARGEHAAGLDVQRQGLDFGQAIGHGVSRAWFLALLADSALDAGDAEAAGAALTEAVANIERVGTQVEEAEVYRVMARLQEHLGRESEARDWLRRARACAHAQQAAGWHRHLNAMAAAASLE